MQALALLLVVLNGVMPGQPRQYLLLGDGERATYELDGGVPLAESDTVYVDGRRLTPGEDYRLANGGEEIVFRLPPARWSTILVRYRSIGGGAIAGGAVRLVPQPESSGAPPDSTFSDSIAAEPPASAALAVSGSKSVGFSIGGLEGNGLNQSTRLVVGGAVEGVEVEAELSDQGTPIPAEGTTRELEELDRIAISLRGGNWSGQFGDVDLSVPQAALGAVQRRAVGGTAEARFGPVRTRLGYARPRGVSVRVAFRGQVGNQGPYVLSPDGRQVAVVPGTERVWLDGSALVRGWDADYTIDYSTGELRFTNRRVITGASRIEASCQFQRDAWQREDVAAGVALLPGGGELALDWFRESDDPARSIALDLDEQDREYLATIGADTARAWLDGGTPVEPGTGSYVFEPDGEYYRYVGEDSGDFRVAFSYVGDSLGDYLYDDTLLYYRHAGPGRGDYVARVRVELPERREWMNARAEFGARGLRATVAGTWLRTARNLLAPGGAGVSDGAAEATLGWETDRAAARYAGAWRSDGVEFSGADSALGFADRWGGVEPGQSRQRHELALVARPADWLEARGEAGLLLTAAEELVRRLATSVRAGFARLAASRAGREARYSASFQPQFGILQPGLDGRFEGDDSAREYRVEARVNASASEALGGGVSAAYDLGALADSARWRADQHGWLTQADLSWRSGERLNVNARVGRQDRTFAGASAADWSRWLGDLSVVALPTPGARVQADLSQSNGVVQAKDEVFRYVGGGNGDFSRDSTSGRYYPDPDGDYERVVVARSEYRAARERSANVGLEMSGWRPLAFFSSLNWSATDTDSGSSAAAWAGTGRLSLRILEPWVEPEVGFDAGSSADRTLAATGQAASHGRVYLEVAARHWPALNLLTRVEKTSERRLLGSLVDHEESGWAVRFEPVVGAALKLEVPLSYSGSQIASPLTYPGLGVFRLQSLDGGLGRSFVVAGRTRVRAELGAAWRWSSVEELPYEVALTRPLGLTPRAALTATHALSDMLTASLGYRFADRPDRPAEHSVTGEVRAYF